MALALAKLLFAFALMALAAFVYRDLYYWFVVPLGAPKLHIAHIYGLVVLKGLLFVRNREFTEEVDQASVAVFLLLSWGVGGFLAWVMP